MEMRYASPLEQLQYSRFQFEYQLKLQEEQRNIEELKAIEDFLDTLVLPKVPEEFAWMRALDAPEKTTLATAFRDIYHYREQVKGDTGVYPTADEAHDSFNRPVEGSDEMPLQNLYSIQLIEALMHVQ